MLSQSSSHKNIPFNKSILLLMVRYQWQTQSCVIIIFLSLPMHLTTVSLSIYLSSYLLNHYLCANALSTQKLSITPKKEISTLGASLLDNTLTLCRQVTRGHYSMSLLPKIYLTGPQRVIRPITYMGYCATDRPSFLCLASTSPYT